jgi:hypothetical protein
MQDPPSVEERTAEGHRLRGGFITDFVEADTILTAWLVLLSGIPQDRITILSRFFTRMRFPAKCDLLLDLLRATDASDAELERAQALRVDLKAHNELRRRLAHEPMVHSPYEGQADTVFLFGGKPDAAEEITFDELQTRRVELIDAKRRLIQLRRMVGPG